MKKLICLALSLLILMSAFPAFALTYDELLQKAADYVINEEYEKAFACYDLAVKSDPNNATAHIRAGLLHLERGELSEAGASIENALAVEPTSPYAWQAKCRIDLVAEDVPAFDADALYAEICGADLSEYAADIGSLYAKAGYSEKAVTYFAQVAVETLSDKQKAAYRRALISCGQKEQVASLGLEAAQTRNENLDAAFNSGKPKLVETPSATIKPQASDFEFTDEAKVMIKELTSTDNIEAALTEALQESDTEFVLLSKSPSGNSAIIAAGTTAVTLYNGKYHIAYPSSLGADDEYSNLNQYYTYLSGRVRSLIGEEGIVYSPDGRYAAILNKRISLINAQFFIDPIILDLSTGGLILTATYPNKIREENAGAVTSAMFSSDNKYFYYILYGSFNGARIRLYRYDLNSGKTEMCLESEMNLYYPHIAELDDGSILLLNDTVKAAESQGLVIASAVNGEWTLTETKLPLDRKYCYAGRLIYSSNAGLACLHETAGASFAPAFQLVDPANSFEGIDKFWCIKKDTNEIVALTVEEYQASFESITADDERNITNFSMHYPYQTILNTVFSPDGNYLLLNTMSSSAEASVRNLFLVRLEDMAILPVTGLNAADINVGALGMNYAINIEWNTDELIIGTSDGIKTFTFASGN